MADTKVKNPQDNYLDPATGKPLAGGSVYVGKQDLNPKHAENRKQVYSRQENGADIPIGQPIKISAGGLLTHNGAQIELRTDGNYSILIEDRNGVTVKYVPSVKNDKAINVFPSYLNAKLHNLEIDSVVMLLGMDEELDGKGGTYAVKLSSSLSTSLPLNNGLFLVLVDGGAMEAHLNSYAGLAVNLLDNSHLEIRERYLAKNSNGTVQNVNYLTDQVLTFNTSDGGGSQSIQGSDVPSGFSYAADLVPAGGKKALIRMVRPLSKEGSPEKEISSGSTLTFQCYIKTTSPTVSIDLRAHDKAHLSDSSDTSLLAAPVSVEGGGNTWAKISTTLSPVSLPAALAKCYSITVSGEIGAPLKCVGWDLKPVPFSTPILKKRESDELAQCQRFWEKSYNSDTPAGTLTLDAGHRFEGGSGVGLNNHQKIFYKVKKHYAGNVSLYSAKYGDHWKWCNLTKSTVIKDTSEKISENGFVSLQLAGPAIGTGDEMIFHWVCDASL